MSLVTVLVCRSGMLLRFIVLARLVMVGRLVVMMCGGRVACRRFVVVLGRGMLSFFGHNSLSWLMMRRSRLGPPKIDDFGFAHLFLCKACATVREPSLVARSRDIGEL